VRCQVDPPRHSSTIRVIGTTEPAVQDSFLEGNRDPVHEQEPARSNNYDPQIGRRTTSIPATSALHRGTTDFARRSRRPLRRDSQGSG
jgi:hypothetical protein